MTLAHQGGWDEILFALVPILIVGALLLLANRRANALRRNAPESDGPSTVAGQDSAQR